MQREHVFLRVESVVARGRGTKGVGVFFQGWHGCAAEIPCQWGQRLGARNVHTAISTTQAHQLMQTLSVADLLWQMPHSGVSVLLCVPLP